MSAQKVSAPALLADVELVLRDYVRVHDNIFHNAIFKIFKKTDFSENARQLASCIERLQANLFIVDSVYNNLSSLKLGSRDAFLLRTLKEYIPSLINTIDLLRNICQQQQMKDDSELLYSRSHYDRDVAAYFNSMKQ